MYKQGEPLDLSGKRVVITYGTFDMFHYGHLELLRRAKLLGDYLVVGVSTDSFNEEKGKSSVIPYEERIRIVSACKYVDLTISENNWEQKMHDIAEWDVDVLVMGDDWVGKFDDIADKNGIVATYLSRTPDVSTTLIKEKIKNE